MSSVFAVLRAGTVSGALDDRTSRVTYIELLGRVIMKRLVAAVVLILALPIARAQEPPKTPPNPEQMRQIMDATMSAMIPYISKMMEAMIKTQLNVVSQRESAEKLAIYARNFYDELIKQGFSKQEALQIVTSFSIPSAAPPTK